MRFQEDDLEFNRNLKPVFCSKSSNAFKNKAIKKEKVFCLVRNCLVFFPKVLEIFRLDRFLKSYYYERQPRVLTAGGPSIINTAEV